MDHISFSYQIVPMLIGFFSFVILFTLKENFSKKKILENLWFSGLVLFGLYFLLMLISTLSRAYQWYYYESTDFVTADEKIRAMRRITRDTGVQFAFIISGVFSFFISSFVFITRLIIKNIKSRKTKQQVSDKLY